MIKKLIYKVSHRHHPWRTMKFDELAEIYTSMSLRSFGFGIIGVFVPLYLHDAGFNFQEILSFFAIFFALRIVFSFWAAYVVGRIGPKHTIAVSTVFTISFLGMLLSMDIFNWPLYSLAFMFNLANSLFFIAYNTDFSKIKDKKHGGKELGWLYIFERFGGALGPVIGGVLASVFFPEASMIFAALVLLGSLIPLFMTSEPVKTHQKINFKEFKLRPHTRDFVSMAAINVQNFVSIALWSFMLGLYIFNDGKYALLGVVMAVSTIISMFTARMYGKFIDSKKGRALLQYGVIMNIPLSISRAIISGSGGALAVSMLGGPIVLSTRMALTKGLYDAADNVGPSRIVYLVWIEIFAAVGKLAFVLMLMVLALFHDPLTVFRIGFAVSGLTGLLMLTQNFKALEKVD